jgi:predicted histone-like DNA-binding protein
MSERIKNTCTVTKADVYAVLVALEDVIIDALSNGEIVRLHNLGTLQIGLHSKGAMSEKQWSVENNKRANVNFRSGRALEKMLNSLNFTKVAIKYVPVAEEEGEEPPVDNGEDEEI